MENAKTELLEALSEIGKTINDILKIAIIINSDIEGSWFKVKGPLHFDSIEALDVVYGYSGGNGEQDLFGIVLFKDGSWLERGEYDGTEWWNYRKQPSVAELDKWVKENQNDIQVDFFWENNHL